MCINEKNKAPGSDKLSSSFFVDGEKLTNVLGSIGDEKDERRVYEFFTRGFTMSFENQKTFDKICIQTYRVHVKITMDSIPLGVASITSSAHDVLERRHTFRTPTACLYRFEGGIWCSAACLVERFDPGVSLTSPISVWGRSKSNPCSRQCFKRVHYKRPSSLGSLLSSTVIEKTMGIAPYSRESNGIAVDSDN